MQVEVKAVEGGVSRRVDGSRRVWHRVGGVREEVDHISLLQVDIFKYVSEHRLGVISREQLHVRSFRILSHVEDVALAAYGNRF